jgi:hypothetical protein
MKRIAWGLVAGLAVFAGGCGGGGDDQTPAETGGATTGTSATPTGSATSSSGNFKEGVDSGRNPDGSDESK